MNNTNPLMNKQKNVLKALDQLILAPLYIESLAEGALLTMPSFSLLHWLTEFYPTLETSPTAFSFTISKEELDQRSTLDSLEFLKLTHFISEVQTQFDPMPHLGANAGLVCVDFLFHWDYALDYADAVCADFSMVA